MSDIHLELLPCPFCGSNDVEYLKDEYSLSRWVACKSCNTFGPYLKVQPGTKEAAELLVSRLWNKRRSEDSAQTALIRLRSIAVLEWYFRDGSVGGACDPMDELMQALGITEEWLCRK